MATLTIEGRRVKIDDAFLSLPPDQQAATVDEIAKKIGIKPKTADTQDTAADANPVEQPDTTAGPLRTVDSFMRGAADAVTSGFADEIEGIGNTVIDRSNPLNKDDTFGRVKAAVNYLSPVTTVTQTVADYLTGDPEVDKAIQVQRDIQADRDKKDPTASAAGRIVGALGGAFGLMKAGAPFMATLPADASFAAKTALAAKNGALYSGLYGLGSGEGVTDRLTQGATNALIGGAIGTAIPGLTAGVKAIAKPVTDAVRGYVNPIAFANQKIAERVANSGMSVDQAAAKMEKNPGLSLADVGGKSTQNLLKTATNIPGPAQQRIYTRLVLKQMQQGDRIRSAVRSTLADPDGYLTAKDDIANNAKTLAAPLFKEANKTAIPFTKSLEDALGTPAGKAALAHAERLAANEQKPFQQYFINMTDDKTGTIRRVPDVRGWEYIRQAFDDMIRTERDPIKGMSNEGRILTGLQNRIFNEVRAANPAYDEGLKIWRGGHTLDEALEAGRESLSQSPEATRRLVAGMSAAEKEAFKIGAADGIRKKIGDTGFTQNAILKFFSNRSQIGNLCAAFDNHEQFAAFRKAMFNEARKRSTYNTVTGNSSTAKQLADMADAGGLNETTNFVKDAATGGMASATLKFIGSRLKMLGGFTPSVADQVAKRLLTVDPQNIKQLTNDLLRIESAKISADQKRQIVTKLITPMLAEQLQGSHQQ